jgi:hypothetical protein
MIVRDAKTVGYSQLYRGIQGFSCTGGGGGGGSETPNLKELKPSFQRYRGLISAVLGPLGPRITIYIGTSHRRSNEPSLKHNKDHRIIQRQYQCLSRHSCSVHSRDISDPISTCRAPSPFLGWNYRGCFTDSVSARTLKNTVQVSGRAAGMSIEACITVCQSGGWALAGVEPSGEYCKSSHFPSSQKINLSLILMDE